MAPRAAGDKNFFFFFGLSVRACVCLAPLAGPVLSLYIGWLILDHVLSFRRTTLQNIHLLS